MNKTNFFAKQAVEQGIFPGPRLLICGEAIIQTGGHTYWCCREASGADEMRRAVREQVRGGADLIKIMACHDTLEFTDEELRGRDRRERTATACPSPPTRPTTPASTASPSLASTASSTAAA